MYRYKQGRKFSPEKKEGEEPRSSEGDCFADKSKHWIICFIVVAVIVLAIGIVDVYEQVPPLVPVDSPPAAAPAAQPAAFSPCPYCRGGWLDGRGRCNIPTCRLYSPSWGVRNNFVSPQAVIESKEKPVLVPEMAMKITSPEWGRGALVDSVFAGGNAQKGGLISGDLIKRFNGRSVKNARRLQSLILQAPPESNAGIVFVRKGVRQRTQVMIGEGEMEGVTQPVNLRSTPWCPRR